MKALVTGASGFIGRRLLTLLNSSGYEFRILGRQDVDGFESKHCDLSRDPIPDQTCEHVDVVFHLAGHAHDLRHADETLYQKVNVEATLQLAELAARSGVKRFLFVSSVKAGGQPVSGTCMSENDQGEPDGIYGKTKREAELSLLEIGRQSSMAISIVRPALVYGPEVKGNLRTLYRAIKSGWFPPLPDIRNRRSMIHVDDLARAIVFIAEEEQASGEIFIATDGKPYSAAEIYQTMREVFGKPVTRWHVPIWFFNLMALLHPRLRHRIDKLFGDECYSSQKLSSLGFESRRTLREMNETDF